MAKPKKQPQGILRDGDLWHPGEYVFEVRGNYGPADDVPVADIIGAWKVGPRGHVMDAFIPNPAFKPRRLWRWDGRFPWAEVSLS